MFKEIKIFTQDLIYLKTYRYYAHDNKSYSLRWLL